MSRRFKIVLASSSPRRRGLLEQLGVPFDVAEPGTVEEATHGAVETRVLENASAKARAVAAGIREGLIIAADTLVEKDGEVFGKAMDLAEAVKMLEAMRGSSHRVVTGLVVLDAGTGKMEAATSETIVHMRDLTDEEVALYVATGEPIYKAGGYAIQGVGALLVHKIEGCFYNVVGLPLALLDDLLERFGVQTLALSR